MVIGNCQAAVIANLIAEKSDNFEIDKLITVHLPDDDKENIYDVLDRADYIVAQNIHANFIGIDTNTIQKMYPNKVVKFLNLHFSGFYQDWTYMPIIQGVRCKSPIGDYYNKTILDSFIEGCSEFEAIRRYKDLEYNRYKYGNISENSLNVLKERELSVDIKMTDVIESNLNNSICSFNTFNPPNKTLLNIQVNRVLDY